MVVKGEKLKVTIDYDWFQRVLKVAIGCKGFNGCKGMLLCNPCGVVTFVAF